MKSRREQERGRWALCFGALGLMVAIGVGTISTPKTADAQPAANQCPTPAKARTIKGAPQFNTACGRCHPNGDEDTGPRLCGQGKTVEEVTQIVRNGHKRMKAIPTSKLSDANLAKVMLFLRGIRAVR